MPYIEIRDYSKSIHSKLILDHINLSFEKGTIYGLVGENGSGKTMLLRVIAGLITGNNGAAYVDGEKVGNGIYPKSIGLVIGNVFLFEYMSAFKNLKMLNEISDNKITDEAIKTWMENFGLKFDDKRSIKKYSLGMNQKVSLIQAFMNKPDLIILDEPTNALDENAVDYLKKLILKTNENNKTTFIIASHDRKTIDDVCDEIIEMRDGKIV